MKNVVLVLVFVLVLIGGLANAQVKKGTFVMTPEIHDAMIARAKAPKPEYSFKIKGNEKTFYFKDITPIIDSISKINSDTVRARFVKCLNVYRDSKGLCPVILNSNMNAAADYIVKYNTKIDGLSHITNVKGYETFNIRLTKFSNFIIGLGGETLFKDESLLFTAADMFENHISYEQAILNTWIKSPAHNKILLIKSVNVVGFSIIDRTYGMIVIDKMGAK